MIRLAIIALLVSILISMTVCKPSPSPYQEMIDSIDSDTRKFMDSIDSDTRKFNQEINEMIDSSIDESQRMDRPEYSKEEVLYAKYSGLLEQIDNNIDRSDSVSELASNL